MEDITPFSNQPQNPEPEWKHRLRERFESVLATLEPPLLAVDDFDFNGDDEDDAGGAGNHPDLYSFFEELAALRTEFRKGNRRSAEGFSRFGESVGELQQDISRLRHQLKELGEAKASCDGLSRNTALAMLDLDDRLQRLREALSSPPRTAPSSSADEWPEEWESARQAVEMLVDHLAALLDKLGMQPMVTFAKPFDPTLMRAIAREFQQGTPPGEVIAEITRGYLFQGEPLRLAEVIVSAPRDSTLSQAEYLKRYTIT